MVQPNKEVLHCGATLKNGEGTPSDNFDRLIHYAKHLPQLPSSSSRCKNDRRRRWVCRLLKMKELPPLIVATDVPEIGESGDQKQSQESCICHADILAFHRERRALEESAAILIQAAFRGYLARKALRALKGVVKLQALIRGWAVRQQAINTLKCLQSIVNIQSEVFSKRCDRIKALHNQDYKSQDVCEKDIKVDSNSQKRWDDSILTKEELKALLLTRRDASIKRERAREYYLNHRRSAETERDKAYGRRRYWLEQWVDSQLAKNDNPGNSDRISSANPRYRDEIGGRLKNFQKQYQADISESPTSAPRRTYHHRKQRSTGDKSSFLGSPSVPAYMASTESAKAKARSLSSPRLRPLSFDVCSEIASPYKQKLSPISSINSELTSSSWIGNHIGSSQRSPRLRGSPGPIKSSMSAKDVRIRGILYQNGVSVAPIDGACTMGNKL